MFFKKVIISLFLLANLTAVNGQVITEIIFEGNSKSKSSFLSETIVSKTGDQLNDHNIKEDINALRSLHLFSDVKAEIEESGPDQIRIRYTVKEVFTIIPILNLGGLSEDHAFWLNVGINEFNAFGKGDVISANYLYIERHSFEVFYQLRKLGNSRLGLSSFASIKASIEPLYFENSIIGFYDFTQWRIEELFTHHHSWNSQFLFGGGFFREQYILNLDRTKDEDEPLIPAKVISDKITIKSIYNDENIDFFGHIKNGYHLNVGTDLIYNINERVFSDALFIKVFFEYKKYIRQGSKSNWANRVFLGFSTNNGSPFTSFVKDDYINARGVGDRSARGYIECTINSEWRQTIRWKKNHYIQLVGFVDINSIVPSQQKISDLFSSTNMDLFLGAGIRLGLQNIYKTIVRCDLSFEPSSGKFSSIIFGLGQFF